MRKRLQALDDGSICRFCMSSLRSTKTDWTPPGKPTACNRCEALERAKDLQRYMYTRRISAARHAHDII